ncbi:MAG: hypothetical protein IJW40_03800 [Clostridia bacterium]|nr:hypothetical protein [Clostridia bacterium]
MKNNLFKRVIAAVLALMLAIGMLGMISCSNEPADDKSDGDSAQSGETPSGSDNTDPAVDEDVPDTDDLPADLNYGGYEFRIATRERNFFHSNWITDDFDGSRINDAIYDRQCAVEERLGISFVENLVEQTEPIRVAMIAGSDDYDMINARCSDSWSYAEQDLYVPVSELTYIDLEKSYWDDNLNAAMTVGGQMYFATGASNITGYDLTHALLFNKEMISDYGLTVPYDLVHDGAWTIEEFAMMAEAVTSDSEGSEDEMVYGFLSQPKQILPGFWIAAGMLSIEKNEEDIPEFTLPGNEAFVELFDLAYEITYDNGSWFVNQSRANEDPVLVDMFQADRGLFYDASCFYIENLRNMETDFGILPYPKYDEAQDDYYSRIEGCEMTGVPVTVADKERTSAVLEALASLSATTVEPAYYDIVLKSQAARDNDSSEMLDIIFANRVFDLGDTIWCDTLRDGVFETMFMQDDRNLSSKLESVTPVLESKIEESVAAFADTQ